MKVLNLYSGIGGNRKLWENVEVTAIENESTIANAYRKNFPDDHVFITDAHQYLLEHFKEFDFIWSSPPCPTHGQLRYRTRVLAERSLPLYPDMKLYEEIIFLNYHFKGKWVVENVESYYEPLIKPQKICRHFIWSNYAISNLIINMRNLVECNNAELEKEYGISAENLEDYRKILRNCVHPLVGKHIFDCAYEKSWW